MTQSLCDRRHARYRACVCTVLAAAVVACATTRPVAEWRDDAYAGGAFDNILIIGVSDQQSIRRLFEDSFVAKLREKGVHAVSSVAVMPADSRIDKVTLKPIVDANGVDAVLVTHFVGVEQREVYRPPSYTIEPYYDSLYGYHGTVSRYVYEPGYYARYKLVKLESNLYDVATEKLVWSMQTETMDPSSEQKLINEKIEVVLKRLGKQGLL